MSLHLTKKWKKGFAVIKKRKKKLKSKLTQARKSNAKVVQCIAFH